MDDNDIPPNLTGRELTGVYSPHGKLRLPRKIYQRQRLRGLSPMELDWRIASLVGSGLTDERIASEMNLDAKLVKRVRKNIPSDPDLAAKADAARAELQDSMIAGAKKALDRMVQGLDGYTVSAGRGATVRVDCQPQQAAAVFRELAKATGLSSPPSSEEEAEVSGKIDFADPKQRFAALRALQKSAIEAEIKRLTPEERAATLPAPKDKPE